MICNCVTSESIEQRLFDEQKEPHDHLNCRCCFPVLEEGEEIRICPECGKKMLAIDGLVVTHHCGYRGYLQNGRLKTIKKLWGKLVSQHQGYTAT